ncbi:MAG: BPL-N domain-containing protein [Firmicutes bacterium]|nr:BPL-N domain-containing protein [Bacillota bacterium]
MSILFLPTDRVGLMNYQPDIPHYFKILNHMLKQNIEIEWHVNGLHFERSQLWPEGHYYQCGYSFTDTSPIRELLQSEGAIVDIVESVPPGLPLRLQKIAFYVGLGTDIWCYNELRNNILAWADFELTDLDDQDIRNGKLREFDLLIVPGSPDAGECYYRGLGERGYDAIRSFIAEGGRYLGVCGGAYFPLSAIDKKTNPYWLNIVNATDDQDLDYWRTGAGLARLKIVDPYHPTMAGLAAGSVSTIDVLYWEGPIIKITGPNIHPILTFKDLCYCALPELLPVHDLKDNKKAHECLYQWSNRLTPQRWQSIVQGNSAYVEANYYKGRLILCSPHPEYGNHGNMPYKDSISFLMIYNALHYLSVS